MTGYGAAHGASRRLAVDAEVRAVNARALKVGFRTPPQIAPREPELEKVVREHIRRGTVTVFLRVEFLQPTDVLRIRPEVVEGFARSLEPLRRKGRVEGKLSPEAVAALPGALEAGAEALRKADWNLVRGTLVRALRALDAMRGREARHLVKDLAGIARRMRRGLDRVRRRAPHVVREHHGRLKERVDGLLAEHGLQIDPATLAREVALLADRSDVTEEVTRLDAHLREFHAYLGGDGEVGRTLDFLAQEMLREVNTIGSKSADVAIARAVIELKSDVDRLKEQVANLE
jgi:uncharacterized protein (TIGR00255 family)